MTTLVRTPARVDEAAARRDLRRQVAHLEARLERRAPGVGAAGPRLLDLADLTATRDALVHAAAAEHADRVRESEEHRRQRRRLDAARADPGAHRALRIPLAALGEPGCGVYRVRPRLGLIGRLAGWWEITLSSGCP